MARKTAPPKFIDADYVVVETTKPKMRVRKKAGAQTDRVRSEQTPIVDDKFGPRLASVSISLASIALLLAAAFYLIVLIIGAIWNLVVIAILTAGGIAGLIFSGKIARHYKLGTKP